MRRRAFLRARSSIGCAKSLPIERETMRAAIAKLPARGRVPAQMSDRPCRSTDPARAHPGAARCGEISARCGGAKRGRAKKKARGSENRSAARCGRTFRARARRLRVRCVCRPAVCRAALTAFPFAAVIRAAWCVRLLAVAAMAGNSANVRETRCPGNSTPHSALPMRRGKTQRTRPPRAFLSPARMGRNCEASNSGERRQSAPRSRSAASCASRRDSRRRPVARPNKRGRHHPPGNRFAVQKAPVTRGRFQRMAQRVAEIQDLAQAAFALVFAHHMRFDANAARDHPGERGGIAAQQRKHVRFEKREKFGVGDDAVLHHFVEAGAVFPVRQRQQNFRDRRSPASADKTRRRDFFLREDSRRSCRRSSYPPAPPAWWEHAPAARRADSWPPRIPPRRRRLRRPPRRSWHGGRRRPAPAGARCSTVARSLAASLSSKSMARTRCRLPSARISGRPQCSHTCGEERTKMPVDSPRRDEREPARGKSARRALNLVGAARRMDANGRHV